VAEEELVRRPQEPRDSAEERSPPPVTLPPRAPRAVEEAPPAAASPEDVEPRALVEGTTELGGERLEHSLTPGERSDAPPREVLEDFEELEVIGTGGAGVVTRARERSTGEFVAIKRLRKPIDRMRFLQEAAAIASLDHPGIVRLHRVVGEASEEGDPEAPLALILELVEGSDLERLVVAGGPLPVAQALALGIEVAHALAHAHERGLVHRDVKPSNVLIDAEGRARLTDFGLALVAEAQLSITPTGAVLGTPSYMAPEQLGGAHEVDARADVYGLGATLYRLLTGRSPRVIRERYLPSEVADLVLRCVEEEPEARYADMRVLGQELARTRERVLRDASGVHDPLEQAIERVQRQLSASQREDLGKRFLAAVVGLANLELVPRDAPRRVRSRLDLGEHWASLIEDLVDEVLVASATRGAQRPRLLRDAHALLSAALSRSTQARPQLKRLLESARRVVRDPPGARLSRVVERLVTEGALESSDLRAIAQRSGPARVVLESVLTRIRLRAEEAGLEGTRRARRALSELQLLIPEWAARIEEEDLALALREASERSRRLSPEDCDGEGSDSNPLGTTPP
jgi:serine/threonine protein kinase